MIPWRLTFSGIRDYPPTLLDLSGDMDHVLITGPNGAGKSTITFCMGAVLYSSKVDIEGLKSRNLPPSESWKSKISLVFKNEGLMKIDAPNFIEFSVIMVQDPGQPLKKEFFISSGDVIDQCEETIRYTSGDKFYNFTAYKRDLQYKYKVDPDLFYLIWYQQEVNQFAVMNPEERFRIFSEMHGIDQVQRDWEESMEKVKETEESLRAAETHVKIMKSELSIKRTALDKFLANQKRLKEGGMQFTISLLQLETYYKKEIERTESIISNLAEQISELKDHLVVNKGLKVNSEEQLTSAKEKHQQLELTLDQEEQQFKQIDEKIKRIQSRIETLDRELEAITIKKNQVNRTEEEVIDGIQKLKEEQEKTSKELVGNQDLLAKNNGTWQEKVELISQIQQEVKNDEQVEQTHLERLNLYKSSHSVQQKIKSLEENVLFHKEIHFRDSQQLKDLKEELSLLQEDRDLSIRQRDSIKFLGKQNIKAFTLREFLELDGNAKLKDEQLFNTIKYTIFFNGKYVTPPNDLYHVPLMTVVPDRVITHLPSLHLKVRDGLDDEVLTFAMKAIWWVEQFFKKESYSIQNGTLNDPMGLRGPQEKERYILSLKALRIRKQEVEKVVSELSLKLSNLDVEISSNTRIIQELNSIIHQVKESEAFMTNEHERVSRKRKLDEELGRKTSIETTLKELEIEKEKIIRLQINQEILMNELEEEAKIYEELGKMKDKYEERNQLQIQLVNEKDILRNQKIIITNLYEEVDQLERDMTKMERTIRHLNDVMDDAQGKILGIEKQRDRYIEQMDTDKMELVHFLGEISELPNLIPDLYSEACENAALETIPTLSQLKNNRVNGKALFDNARTEKDIDPAAQENYDTVKNEYERLDNEYKRTKILLEQDKERMEKLRDQLETTINMRVLELQQRFKYYMSQFQFEGEISWESYEDRRQRTHFNLFIKARKEGHRGVLEDVSIKARGGRVGKGVSGGEESLSSLLFALALLQNLQTTPGFIVLDEFDSALDEHRKVKVFDLYENELKRKLIILTPKSHEETYLDRFSKAFVVQHDPTVPKSRVVGIVKALQTFS